MARTSHHKTNSLNTKALQAVRDLMCAAKDLEETTYGDEEIREVLDEIEAYINDIRANMES